MGKAAFEDALQAWAKGAAGVEAVWVRQKMKTPIPGLTLLLEGPKSLSATPERWHEYSAPAELPAPAPVELNPPGQEIIHSARDNESWALTLQAYTKDTSGDADAAVLLQRCKNSLKLQGTLDTLRAAGITVADVGDVKNVAIVLDTEWQGRAVMTLLLWTADVSTERGTFIETVAAQGQGDLVDVVLP